MPDEVRPKHPVPKIPDVVSFIRRFGDHKTWAMYQEAHAKKGIAAMANRHARHEAC